jgi:toxin YoeB
VNKPLCEGACAQALRILVSYDFSYDDHASWADDRRMLKRINPLIEEASLDPGAGIGKPERLSGDLAGYWSRRIDQQHRLVYTLRGEDLVIVQACYHY